MIFEVTLKRFGSKILLKLINIQPSYIICYYFKLDITMQTNKIGYLYKFGCKSVSLGSYIFYN